MRTLLEMAKGAIQGAMVAWIKKSPAKYLVSFTPVLNAEDVPKLPGLYQRFGPDFTFVPAPSCVCGHAPHPGRRCNVPSGSGACRCQMEPVE